MTKPTEEQQAVLDALNDDAIEAECDKRGIWPDASDFPCDECDDCPDCVCEDFEGECMEVWRLFYMGKDEQAIESAKKLVSLVTGRYL